jgi:demethylmenaquinone methyltransferase/2-methoxy-6-polyprenyl-1,4-benzoquinol methylase
MPLPPHPPLAQYAGSPTGRQRYVNALFDTGAPHYDRIASLMSFGTGGLYRRHALRRHGLRPGMRMLDVATGTGLVARAAADILGAEGSIVGLDPSRAMLDQSQGLGSATLVQGVGEALPFADGTFDFLTMGYALRHVPDLETTFREYRRVLRRDGRVLILEISRPESSIGRGIASVYFGRIVPIVTRIGTGSTGARDMMKYYWDTIEQCVPPPAILGALAAAGFQSPERVISGGIFSEFAAIA